ncbi:MAG: family 43 glycosylhydrolase, partial [Ruminococcus sp.]|nr:family 43 glycosylhydrolase [Ruminococcus sp.]
MKHFNPRKAAASILAAAVVALPAVTASASIVSTPAGAASTINNPIIWADVPDDDIIRVGDTYYMVSTTMFFSPVAPIMKSKDLANWEICNYVCDIYANGDVQNLKNGKHDYSHGQ